MYNRINRTGCQLPHENHIVEPSFDRATVVVRFWSSSRSRYMFQLVRSILNKQRTWRTVTSIAGPKRQPEHLSKAAPPFEGTQQFLRTLSCSRGRFSLRGHSAVPENTQLFSRPLLLLRHLAVLEAAPPSEDTFAPRTPMLPIVPRSTLFHKLSLRARYLQQPPSLISANK